MHALNYISSRTLDDVLKALTHLQNATGESWEMNWEKLALTCKHGASMPVNSVLGESQQSLGRRVASQHQPSAASKPR
jgi:hypothetical protein